MTLVGSVANVIVADLARSQARLSFRAFPAVGVPITLLTRAWGVAVLALYALRG